MATNILMPRTSLDAGGEDRADPAFTHPARPVRRGRLGRAIVVDDDILVRLMLAEALEQRGFEVLTAPNGMVGLQLLSETILTIDVLVTDAIMPGIDGAELVSTIRTAGGESELRVVAVTASEDPFRRTLLLEAGVDLVLSKSLGPAAIALAVEAMVLEELDPNRRPLSAS